MITRWEYRYLYFKTNTNEVNQIEQMLNQMGEQGWELIDVVDGTGEHASQAMIHGYYFKRQVK